MVIEGIGEEVVGCFVLLTVTVILTVLFTYYRKIFCWQTWRAWLYQQQEEAYQRLSDDQACAQVIYAPAPVNECLKVNKTEEADSSSDLKPPTLPADEFTVCLKFLDDSQRVVSVSASQTVREFTERALSENIERGETIRLIYKGKLLRDQNCTLQSCGIKNNNVIHCHISRTPLSQTTYATDASGIQANASVTNGPGIFIYYIFAFKFLVLWACYFNYPAYFDRTGTVSLCFCTLIYCIYIYSSVFYVPPSENRNSST